MTTESDRELLELAAKAAGHAFAIFVDGKPVRHESDGHPVYWNPLTDPGDALRLAVKLRLPIRDALNGTVETGNAASGRPIWEFWEPDPESATCRAIVRAAAEIGRNMK